MADPQTKLPAVVKSNYFMLQVPLNSDEFWLHSDYLTPRPFAKERCFVGKLIGRRVTQLQDTALNWWSLTTSPEFLNSKASRRAALRQGMFPLMCFCFIMDSLNIAVGGITGPKSIQALGTCFVLLVAFHFFRRFPTDRLLPDYIGIVGIAMHILLLLQAVGPQGLDRWIGYVSTLPAVAFFFGWHSTCIFGLQTFLLGYIYCLNPYEVSRYHKFMCPMYTLISLFGALQCEYWLASLVKELGEQSCATQRLLDRTTDGFCTMDAHTGTILCASPSLERSLVCRLNSGAVVGRRLADFVDGADALQLQCMQGLLDAKTLHSAPMLLTFHQLAAPSFLKPLASFDATLIAYAASDTEVQICIKRLGEVRPFKTKKRPMQKHDVPSLLLDVKDNHLHSDSTSLCGSESELWCNISDQGSEASLGNRGPTIVEAPRAGSLSTLSEGSPASNSGPPISAGSEVSFAMSSSGTLAYSADTMPTSDDTRDTPKGAASCGTIISL